MLPPCCSSRFSQAACHPRHVATRFRPRRREVASGPVISPPGPPATMRRRAAAPRRRSAEDAGTDDEDGYLSGDDGDAPYNAPVGCLLLFLALVLLPSLFLLYEVAFDAKAPFSKDLKVLGGVFGIGSSEGAKEDYKPHHPVSDTNPKVFLQVALGGIVEPKLLIIELFADTVPLTAENFRALCTGEKGMGEGGKLLSYRGSPFHRIVEGFMCQGGDITKENGTGGESIYGPYFADEDMKGKAAKHVGPGIISMANSGANTNSSQFFVVTNPTPHLDGKHVVFGQVIEGFETLLAISKCGTSSGLPKKHVIIVECGQL